MIETREFFNLEMKILLSLSFLLEYGVLIIILLRSSQAFLFVEVAIETEQCVFSDIAEETLQTN